MNKQWTDVRRSKHFLRKKVAGHGFHSEPNVSRRRKPRKLKVIGNIWISTRKFFVYVKQDHHPLSNQAIKQYMYVHNGRSRGRLRVIFKGPCLVTSVSHTIDRRSVKSTSFISESLLPSGSWPQCFAVHNHQAKKKKRDWQIVNDNIQTFKRSNFLFNRSLRRNKWDN